MLTRSDIRARAAARNPEYPDSAIEIIADLEWEREQHLQRVIASPVTIERLDPNATASCSCCGRHSYESGIGDNESRVEGLALHSIRFNNIGGSGTLLRLCGDCLANTITTLTEGN
jgi:hypothetical protein